MCNGITKYVSSSWWWKPWANYALSVVHNYFLSSTDQQEVFLVIPKLSLLSTTNLSCICTCSLVSVVSNGWLASLICGSGGLGYQEIVICRILIRSSIVHSSVLILSFCSLGFFLCRSKKAWVSFQDAKRKECVDTKLTESSTFLKL